MKSIGFLGPKPGGSHIYLYFGERRLWLPSNSEYSVEQFKTILRQVAKIIGRNIDWNEWNSL